MYKKYCLYPQGYSPAPSMINRGRLIAFKGQAKGFQPKEICLRFTIHGQTRHQGTLHNPSFQFFQFLFKNHRIFSYPNLILHNLSHATVDICTVSKQKVKQLSTKTFLCSVLSLCATRGEPLADKKETRYFFGNVINPKYSKHLAYALTHQVQCTLVYFDLKKVHLNEKIGCLMK